MIEFKNVSVSIGQEKVFGGFNFTLRKGAFAVIHGPTGAGKSLLLQLLVTPGRGRLSPTVGYSGSISVDSLELKDLDHDQRRHLLLSSGIVLQQPAVVESATVMKHLSLPGVKPSEVEVMLKFLGLENMGHRKVRQISYGQKRILDLGRSLMMHPNLVIWDEPFAGVDSATVKRLVSYLVEMTKEGKTVMVLTSDEWLVEYLKEKTAKVERLMVNG